MVDGDQDVRFLPASSFSLAFLADLYTQTFADYFFPCDVTTEDLAGYVRIEQLDLDRCPVMLVGETPVGFATVGIRGAESYCKGFGVIVPFRGKGLSHPLCKEMMQLAREAGARRMGLGVIKGNTRAVSTYQQAGFQVLRELVSLEWRADDPESRSSERMAAAVVTTDPRKLLEHFYDLHPVRPIWNRDLPSLREMEDAQGAAVFSGEAPAAYVLFQPTDHGADIVDLGARGGDEASQRSLRRVLWKMQQEHPTLVCHNEPADNPWLAALLGAGFGETVRRYELERAL